MHYLRVADIAMADDHEAEEKQDEPCEKALLEPPLPTQPEASIAAPVARIEAPQPIDQEDRPRDIERGEEDVDHPIHHGAHPVRLEEAMRRQTYKEEDEDRRQ